MFRQGNGLWDSIPLDALAELRELKELSLTGVRVDDHILPTLAQLTGLTYLHLKDIAVKKEKDFYPQITLLTGLKHLSIETRGGHYLPAYLQNGSMAQLRFLKMDYMPGLTTPKAESHLRAALPRLRAILYHR